MNFNALTLVQSRPTMRRLAAAALSALVALVLLAAPLAAQSSSAAGTVAGRVSDAATGKSLQGAVIKVLGTTAVAYTDAEGRFSLPGLAAGSYKVEVDYVGLDPYFTQVTVASGQVAGVNALLESTVLKMQSFTVAETTRGQAQAINQQKTASGIVNIVSEETFGQMLDGNIGYALQRLPGLTVNEDEDGTPTGVNIRGLESKYNSFQVDGNRLPTSGNTRAFSTNQLTADGVSNIEVIKAPTPDRDGDAIGGIINVTSRSAFQRDGRTIDVNASGLYYDKNKQWGYNGGLTYSDLLGVFGGEKNFGVSFSATNYQNSRDYDNLDKDYALLRPQFDPQLNLKEPIYFHTNGTPQTNFRETKAQGFTLALDYRLNPGLSVYLKPFYSTNTVDAEKPRTRYYVNSNHNFTGTTGTKSILEASYNTGRSLASRLEDIRFQNDLSSTDNDVRGVSFGGKQQLDTITATVDAFYSKNESTRGHSLAYVVRNPGYNIAYDMSDRAHPNYTILNGKDPYDISAISRGDLTIAPRSASEEARSIRGDWEKKIAGAEMSSAIKFGVKYRENEKDQNQSSDVYRTGTAASGFPYASFLRRTQRTSLGVPLLLDPDLNKVEALFKSSPNLFVLDTAAAARDAVINDYHAKEDITAAYGMGTVRWGRTTLVTGLRMEKNGFSSTTYRFNSATPNAATRISREKDYTVWLPGFHLRHELSRNLILRESYNRSYARPDVDKLVAGLNLDSATGNISGGNPDLKHSTAENYEVQLEFYTAKGGLYSAGVFYKDIKGFYYDSTVRFNTVGADGYPIPDVNGALTFSRPENALGATNYGLELIARQKLFFLPKPLDGFAVSLSSTFTESDGRYPGRLTEKLPTYGFSDYIFYGALEYTYGKFRAQLSYRYRSDYLEGLDVDNTFDDYFGAYEAVEWESSYQLAKNIRLFFNVNNLSNEPQVSYQGYKHTDNPEDITTYGRRATVGVSMRF